MNGALEQAAGGRGSRGYAAEAPDREDLAGASPSCGNDQSNL